MKPIASSAPLRLGLFATLLLATVPAQERPDGKLTRPMLVVLDKSAASASLLDPTTGEEHARLPVGVGPHEAATAGDGRTVVVTDYGTQKPGNTLTVIDAVDAKVVRTIELVREVPAADGEGAPEVQRFLRPHGVLFLDDDHVVVTSEAARKLIVVDVREGVVEDAIDTKAQISHMVALSPDKTRAYVANIGSGSVSVIDLDAREHVGVVATGEGAEGIAVHKTGEVWVANRAANTISIVDPESLEEIAEFECGAFPIRVTFTTDGSHALVSCAQAGTLEAWHVERRELAHEVAMDEAPIEDTTGDRLFAGAFDGSPVPVGVLVEPNGHFAFVANTQADIVTVVDLREWKIARRLKAGPQPDGMAWVPAASK